MSGRITVLHGPNLNLLGTREPELYGCETLDALNASLAAHAATLGLSLTTRQSNHEGELVSWIQACRFEADALILNAAAYTHTSVAIRDAVVAISPIPTIEVHLTVPSARESFRHNSLLADVVTGRVEGFGALSYVLALSAAKTLIAPRGHSRDQ